MIFSIRVCMAGLFLVIAMGLNAAAVDLSERHIPFLITADSILSGTLDNRFVPGGKSMQVKPDFTSDTSLLIYGLLVPGKSETTVTVNGLRLDLMPLERQDSRLYMIDSNLLSDGPNAIRIDRSEPASWAGVVMFSLTDTFEEAHFQQAFGETNAAAAQSVREVPPSATQEYYDALWYDCTWVPSMNAAFMNIGSEATMGARALFNLQQIELDFDMNPLGNGGAPMQIDYVDSGAGTSALAYTVLPDTNSPRIRITLPAPVGSGTDFIIRIGYHGAPNNAAPSELFGTNALHAQVHGVNNRPVIYSVSQAYGGRRWWPSKDHPSDKATTTIQRIIVPKQAGYTLTAVSNGTLTQTIDHGTTLEYVWNNSYPIATYLMSLAISDYIYRGGTYTSRDGLKTMPVGHWIYPEHDGFEGNGYLGTLQAMNFFADVFGEYPFLNEKYHTAAWNISYAIEHQTATSMPGGTSTGVANGLTRRNVHELAHQWFGNKLSMHNWDHLWLNEGFATYCEALFFEHSIGDTEFHNIVNGWSVSTTDPVVGPNSDKFDGGTVYRRGAWVLHMLRFTLGDDKFFAAMRAYADAGYTTANSQPQSDIPFSFRVEAPVNFQSIVEQAALLPPGSAETFFNQWLYSPNTSVVSCKFII